MADNMTQVELPTTGRVIIHTSSGPLEVELWAKEAPLTSRNFIQLCLEGYYDNTIFHRIVQNFIIQGGDPTGTGSGGASAIEKVPAEYNTRLKWTRRGLLGMVAMNEQGEGGSQFFFTLAEAPELYKKATLFGRIVGNTIYNLMEMNDLPTDKTSERFISLPPKIIRTEVLINPFDDILPRELEEVRQRRIGTSEGGNVKKSTTIPPESITTTNKRTTTAPLAAKNKKTLSFDQDEDEDGDEDKNAMTTMKIKSSHEILINDPTLSKQTIQVKEPSISSSTKSKDSASSLTKPSQSMTLLEFQKERASSNTKEIQDKISQVRKELASMDRIQHNLPSNPSLSSIKKGEDSLTKLLGIKRKTVNTAEHLPPSDSQSKDLKAFKERNRVIIGKKGRSALDEMDTLLALNNFREKLCKTSSLNDPTTLSKITIEPSKQLDICKLHGLVNCESCRNTFGIQGKGGSSDLGEEGWLMHRLVFDKEAGYREIRNDLDQLKVIDPRERAERFADTNKDNNNNGNTATTNNNNKSKGFF